MTWGKTSREQESVLQNQPEVRFVRRDEYCQLLVSSKKLIRSDEPASRYRGLLDVKSGARYLIDKDELFRCV